MRVCDHDQIIYICIYMCVCACVCISVYVSVFIYVCVCVIKLEKVMVSAYFIVDSFKSSYNYLLHIKVYRKIRRHLEYILSKSQTTKT